MVENDNLEVGDEDWVYEPSVGDEVEGNGNSDGRWGRSSCVHACDGCYRNPLRRRGHRTGVVLVVRRLVRAQKH